MEHEDNALTPLLSDMLPITAEEEEKSGFRMGTTRSQFGSCSVVLWSYARGELEACRAITRLVTTFPSIQTVIFVGCAGAKPGNKPGLSIGDVVIPRVLVDQVADNTKLYPPIAQDKHLMNLLEEVKHGLTQQEWEKAASVFLSGPNSDERLKLLPKRIIVGEGTSARCETRLIRRGIGRSESTFMIK